MTRLILARPKRTSRKSAVPVRGTAHRALASSAYVVAGMLIVLPLLDLAGANLSQRLPLLSVLSKAMLLSVAGVLLAVATSVVVGHPRTQRALGMLSWAGALAMVGAVALLVMEMSRARAGVAPARQHAFVIAAVTTALRLGAAAIALAMCGRAARSKQTSLKMESGSPMLLRQEDFLR